MNPETTLITYWYSLEAWFHNTISRILNLFLKPLGWYTHHASQPKDHRRWFAYRGYDKCDIKRSRKPPLITKISFEAVYFRFSTLFAFQMEIDDDEGDLQFH